MAIDFEAEGLLEGVEGRDREARRQLLEQLAADGVSLDEMRRAVAEDRLALLPVERVLAAEGDRYTAAEVADRAGHRARLSARQWQALGMPQPPGLTTGSSATRTSRRRSGSSGSARGCRTTPSLELGSRPGPVDVAVRGGDRGA